MKRAGGHRVQLSGDFAECWRPWKKMSSVVTTDGIEKRMRLISSICENCSDFATCTKREAGVVRILMRMRRKVPKGKFAILGLEGHVSAL